MVREPTRNGYPCHPPLLIRVPFYTNPCFSQTGDGRADLIWTDKFSGDATVWYNKGVKDESDRDRLKGSLVEWEGGEKAYQGSTRGPNIHFPNLGGQGRADMVGTNPSTGEGWVWFNSCPGGGGGGDQGGDEGDVKDPRLPKFPPSGELRL